MASMVSNETQKEQLENLISCAICLDPFKDPRILPCSHTFCFQCIRKTAASNRGRFLCSLRDGTEIKQEHIDSLPINRVLPGIVDFIQNMLHTTAQNHERCKCICNEEVVSVISPWTMVFSE